MSDLSYGFLQRTLHRILLGNRAVPEFCLDFECARTRVDREAVAQMPHVLVAGLARAGTTILMRRLHGSGAFACLTYRDMPFVLMPMFWKRISGGFQRDMEKHERAHGDGLMVDFDSPEAFEEIFWKALDGPAYIRPDHLRPHAPDDKLLDRYRHYIGLVIQSREGPPRPYLAKNNNNLLRLGALARALPRALLLVPYREPLQHAASLLRQHRRFCERARHDRFSADYMEWLGHYEFGARHRPFRLGDAPNPHDPDTLDYWLQLWNEVYGWLLETAPPGALFVGYASLCEDPACWQRIARRAGIAQAEALEPLRLARHDVTDAHDPALAEHCRQTHERLEQAAADRR